MSRLKEWRGLRALIEDAVEHGSRAVERIHLDVTARRFAIVERIPAIAAPACVVHVVHDAAVSSTYAAVRLVSRVVGASVDAAMDVVENAREERHSGVVAVPSRSPDPAAAD